MANAESDRQRLRSVWDAKFERRISHADDELRRHLQLRLAHTPSGARPALSYQPLAGPSYTRFIELYPGEIGDEICCEVDEEDLDAVEFEYIALSYTWGDDECRLPIVCNGAVALVSVNLYSALLRLRETNGSKILWADALCIDQGRDPVALKERAQQVRMMSRIFTKALAVFVDLGGASDEESSALFEDLTKFTEPDHRMFLPHESTSDSLRRSMNEQEKRFWRLYREFINRAWFKRVWVVQEFVLAKNVVYMYGLQFLSEKVMFYAMQNVGKHFGMVNTHTTMNTRADWTETLASNFRDLMKTRYSYRLQGEPPPVTVLLQNSVHRLASDPRDHLYALLGLMSGRLHFSEFNVDYMEDLETQAVRLAECLVTSGLGEYCLIRADGSHWRRRSWIPVLWQFELTTAASNLIDENGAETCFSRIYRACGPTTISMNVMQDESVLTIRGIRVDSIESFSKPLIAFTRIQTLFRDGTRAQDPSLWYQDTYRWASRTFFHWEPEMLDNTFWRTLILDAGDSASGRARASSTSGFETQFAALQQHFGLDWNEEQTGFDTTNQDVNQNTYIFRGTASDRCHMRKLCRTKGDRMALIPAKSVHDNEIWVFSGITVPFVLRRLGERHVFVGPCYVHGIMDGEALQGSDWKEETVYLQ